MLEDGFTFETICTITVYSGLFHGKLTAEAWSYDDLNPEDYADNSSEVKEWVAKQTEKLPKAIAVVETYGIAPTAKILCGEKWYFQQK